MKPCRICKTKFEPARPLQRVCSPVCALKHAKAKMAAEAKKAQAADRQETKPFFWSIEMESNAKNVVTREANGQIK